MVQLFLSSYKGNQGTRFFPYTGYLGLTPIKVEGIVRTKLEGSAKLLAAKSITVSVRCCENRIGRTGILTSNVLVDYTQVLWSKPDDQEYAEIGDLEYPFQISIPPKVAGFSTVSFVEYRCVWKVEAVLNHLPITGVGVRQIKHFELPLIRYDLPFYSESPKSPLPGGLNRQTSKPHIPSVKYSLNSPTYPIGPLDLVSISLRLLPLDSTVTIRSASVIIERRIQFSEASTLSSSLPTPGSLQDRLPSLASSSSSSSTSIHITRPSSSRSHLSTASHQDQFNGFTSPSLSTLHSTSTSQSTLIPEIESRNLLSQSPLIPSTAGSVPPSSKVITTSIAGTESSGRFSQDSDGVWHKTLTLQWPAAKPYSQWAIGETLRSDLVSVKFFAKVKVIISSPSGTESVDLSQQELLIVCTNEAERHLAISKYNERLYSSSFDDSGRAKSKSPRRRRERDPTVNENTPLLDREIPAVPKIPPRVEHAYNMSTSSAYTPPRPKSSPSRRPHTSAGPRDKSSSFGDLNTYSRVHNERDASFACRSRFLMNPRPDTAVAASVESSHLPSNSQSAFGQKWLVIPQLPSSARPGSARAIGEPSDAVDHVQVQAWEEELRRIEIQSRRSTADMPGSACKRKRINGEVNMC